jgi:hypothetical protein
MIGKKVPNPKRSASKAARVHCLGRYIEQADASREECLYHGSDGFITTDHESQHAEMTALAMEAVRSSDPICHYVLSWREGEQPTHEQCDEAVRILLREMHMEGHQVIYGLHTDTDNLHLHVMVNRVSPETERVVKVAGGFEIEALHRAVARMENAQGWEREANGRYCVLENGELARVGTEKRIIPSTKARDLEVMTGQRSAQRTGMEVVPEIIKRAQSWDDLHRQLSEAGMRYERKGSGAILYVNDQPMKASTADRNAGLSKLEQRFGPYEPARDSIAIKERAAEPVQQKAVSLEWGDYQKAWRESNERRNAARNALRQKIEIERKELRERQRHERAGALGLKTNRHSRGKWQGRGNELNILRSVLAAKNAAEREQLKDAHSRELSALRSKHPAFPTFEMWLAQERNAQKAKDWRYRNDQAAGVEGPPQQATPRDIRSFSYTVIGAEIHYSRGADVGAAFVDKGKRIDIHDWRDRDSLLAALQLSQAKWGAGFVVTGGDEYKAACVRLAAERGFRIQNPELQKAIEVERRRIQEERTLAMKAPQLQQFEAYHKAVQADRYRVTSIRMFADGGKKTFILDKQNGVTHGFTSAELAQRMAEMQRLQGRGGNLYFTPMSAKFHHILIDDMDRSNLDRLIADGYKPAAVLESSPGNYQAIITVPKLGTTYDREVGNRLAERLNREYGDPKLSGCIYPHRAPGFENRKPSRQREDGSYPEVRLLKAEHRECGKALELSREIDVEYAQQAEKQAVNAAQRSAVSVPRPGNSLSLSQVYDAHRMDILSRQKGEIDYSRLDSMIALRMRATMHTPAQTETSIRDGAQRCRPDDLRAGHLWDDYAKRTAASAYTPRADRQLESLAPRYAAQWARLEGREFAWERAAQHCQRQKVSERDRGDFGIE